MKLRVKCVNLVLRPPAQTLSRSRGENSPIFLHGCETKSEQEAWGDFSPRLQDKVWAGGLGTRLGMCIKANQETAMTLWGVLSQIPDIRLLQ